jgi:SAM-dependent methyltransferase
MMKNIDKTVVDDFGHEWEKFNHLALKEDDIRSSYDQYFRIFPFDELGVDSEGFDMGCGSGRWAKFVAPQVGTLNCIDPSSAAIEVAKKSLSQYQNTRFHNGSVGDNMLPLGSQDFGYCLGVLHHVPDTLEGIKSCAKLLKEDAPFLLYLYYSLENRPVLFRFIWKMSDYVRKVISILPKRLKMMCCSLIALFVYWPLARCAFLLERCGFDVSSFPLNDYREKTYYFMNNDALDRFGTRLEKRFSKQEITDMLTESGFKDIMFSEDMPCWVCVARKT